MRKFLFSLFFIYFAHYVILLSKGKYNDSGQQSIHWHEHWSMNLSVAVNLSWRMSRQQKDPNNIQFKCRKSFTIVVLVSF